MRRKFRRMIDYFALLGQPRQPHLDSAVLELEFRKRALSLHPDAQGRAAAESDAFSALNQAFTTLRNPRLRLHHLLVLEGAEYKQNSLPKECTDLFSRAAEIASRARRQLQREGTAKNAITRSMSQIERTRTGQELNALLRELEANEADAENELRSLDEQWHHDRAAAIESAQRLQHRFTFVQKWIASLRELAFELQN